MRYSGITFLLYDINGNRHKVRQVTKSKAKKVYDNGECVWMHPCNLRINVLQTPYPIDNSNGDSFEKVVTAYRYFNPCNKELGRYPIYFVPIG